jgi:large subunit ribosomal protein L24
MQVKKGDKVKVITGQDKNKEGIILKSLPSLHKVIVEGVNIKTKHKKSNKSNQKGEIVKVASPIDVSNVKKIA